MPQSEYIVNHTAVMLPSREKDVQMGPIKTKGQFISRSDVPTQEDWDKLVQSGAVKKADDREKTIAVAYEKREVAVQSVPSGDPEADLEKAAEYAQAERLIAEPPAVPPEPPPDPPVAREGAGGRESRGPEPAQPKR